MKRSLGAKTLVCPTPVWVIGTYDKDGKANVVTAAWVGICCSNPPAVAVSLRKATYTYKNIMERKAFTVNLPPESYVEEVDYFGIVSGKQYDKFAISGLTPIRSDLVDAPYVKEFPFIVECRLLNHVEIGLHTQFIGEIIDIKAEESVLGEKGVPDVEKIKPILYVPGSSLYYGVGRYIGKAFSIGRKNE